MAKNTKLLALRDRIDAIDTEVLELLNARAACAEEVAVAKRAESESSEEICFYRPEREAQILQRMMQENAGPLRDEQITHIYRGIISSCLALEQCLKVTYLGPKGTFTQNATRKHFGDWITAIPQESITHVFEEVERGNADYGVIPVENSTGGVITHTLDMFINSSLSVCGEIQLLIHQNLMTLNEDWKTIERVYSHQQSLSQCKHWLREHMPLARPIPVASNAEAAKMASEDPKAAAIAGVEAAEIYGLPIIHSKIEDLSNNVTRFIVIARQTNQPSGYDKTSLLVSAKNKPGSLYNLLKPLAAHGLDMSRIESRPSQVANWDYIFFLDIDGHAEDENVKKALEEIKQEADLLRVLGSYPKAIL